MLIPTIIISYTSPSRDFKIVEKTLRVAVSEPSKGMLRTHTELLNS